MQEKESLLDVLVYLLESYIDRHAEDSFSFDPAILSDELEGAGFADEHVMEALQWLVELRDTPLHNSQQNNAPTIRIFSDDEKRKINPEIRALLTMMERDEIIDTYIREIIIDRTMALNHENVELRHMKWIMLFILCFSNSPNVRIQKFENVVMMDASSNSVH